MAHSTQIQLHAQVALLLDRIRASIPSAQQAAVVEFATSYFAATPHEELDQRRVDDLYGMTISCWNFLQERNNGSSKIRIFNPDYEEHGWQSTHSIIEIISDDLPFLVDSVRMELNKRDMSLHFINHAVLPMCRDAKGKLDSQNCLNPATGKHEVVIYVEIDRHTDAKVLHALLHSIEQVIADVRLVVDDFTAIKDKAVQAIEHVEKNKGTFSAAEMTEAKDFILWMLNNHFTFLACEDFEITEQGKKQLWRRVKNSGCGLFRAQSHGEDEQDLNALSASQREVILAPQIISFSKSSRRSTVHRPAYPDYITVRYVDKNGQVTGGRRFMGMFTSKVYTESPFSIPIVRNHANEVMARSGFKADSHNGKELRRILEVFPRDELIHTDVDQLFNTALGVLNIQERRQTRVFIRQDKLGKFMSCIVYVPRDLYNTELRNKVQHILVEAFAPVDIEFTTFFSESVLARTHFSLCLNPDDQREVDIAKLQQQIQSVARSWQDDLTSALIEGVGEEKAHHYLHLYRNAFTSSYRESSNARTAVVDIQHIQSIREGESIAMTLYRNITDEGAKFRFKLYVEDRMMPLSDVIPILENMGLRVMGEHPYGLTRSDGKAIWIHDFELEYNAAQQIDLHASKQLFQDAFAAIWRREAENDSFNRLLLGAHLEWRDVGLLRAYARYMKQIRFGISEQFIADALCRYPHIAALLVSFFAARFDVKRKSDSREKLLAKLEKQFMELVDSVENLTEDKIFRRYFEIFNATVRTNYFQPDKDGKNKHYFSFKMVSKLISNMPLPRPMFEIFVYSPRVEGVHLRGGKVARGGLRWSDRFEDFRTEVLGLVKAQQVKNAVIVPVGAKGGFVAKCLPEGDRDAIQAEGIACYKIFIRGLLDITDNLINGEVVPPENVVRHDADDPYLVVAADKGTATFSDISNGISLERGFWLGDAFASGGSVGYDHKKMGITARGAWVSVQRHFRERDFNVQQQDFTVVGIGDMAGDVFGNGLLRSEHALLVAAFNHMHIFIDPAPDGKKSFAERQRMFNLPRSSWADYDAKLISKGGGIFLRSAKYIDLTPEMKKVFDIQADRLSPTELISAILKAPVDLIWNGGIGTYVKASSETHADVGDKANDALRINGNELRAKVVGEGGNLGFTQRGRIEYGLKGGASFTDFIDNAGGVDCSDHEVNIKILLNGLVMGGDMTMKQRNQLLVEMTDDVADLVLKNNYRQTQSIALAFSEAKTRIDEYRRLMNEFEEAGKLDRAIEYLPSEDELTERKNQGTGLTRPELSVLICYTKGDLKERLNKAEIASDEYLGKALATAFPARMGKEFAGPMAEHRLRSNIVATQLANEMVNRMGITYVNRMQDSTGSDLISIVKAYVTARDVFSMNEIWQQIETLDYKIPSAVQESMMASLMRLVRRGSRWFLRNRRRELKVADEVAYFQKRALDISKTLMDRLSGSAKEAWQQRFDELTAAGVPETLARSIAGCNQMYAALSIIEAAENTKQPLADVAQCYFRIGCELDLEWFQEQLHKLVVQNHWQALARETYRDDLDWQQRTITESVLLSFSGADMEQRIAQWLEKNDVMIKRWRRTVEELRESVGGDFAMYSVALRELLDLAQASRFSAGECK
ncbi:MAG: NAD-glutamate dehydrogenase [Oceanospirillaceae bacterium]|nr:NAD-glutamate dehydrogenase [Oceanospirillaceae bacterium]MCP5350562.1 NAD-glutamate dehydrogenase [Oceanospirillaceae bacterium]